MASALLASRNEPYWGERKVYMRKNPNSNPHLKVDPNPDGQFRDPSRQINCRHTDKPAAVTPAVSDFSSSLNLNNPKDSSLGGYLTFNIAEYSRRELRELKKRLISELEQVRNLSNRIDLREIQSRSGYSASQFSGSYGGREVNSATRPPPLHLNYLTSDAPGADGLNEKRTPKANQYYRKSEFVTGKDRMLPLDKKVSGSKRPLPFLPGIGRKDLKRPASEPETGKPMKRCRQILTMLMKHKNSWIFNVPVDVVGMGLHDYNQIIKHPMDLGTVKLKLGKNLYASSNDFASDVRLTFNNALMYNPKGHDVYIMAEQLRARFEEMFEPASKKHEDEQQCVVSAKEARRSSWIPMPTPEIAMRHDPLPSSKKPDSVPVRAPVSNIPVAPAPSQAVKQLTLTRLATGGKQPKPKAKDPNKREMSFMEKQKLGMNLQSLPQEKMELVVQIIRKRNGHLAQDGDEIELDIEALDKETLWVLDRFVNNIKKMMSKSKRQSSLTSNPSSAVEGNKYLDSETHEAAKKNKKVETGEEDVDIGDEIPMNNFPPVEIEKDAGHASSRSSSSSGSGSDSSSSSGSDSGSSSGSDTDAEDAESAKRFPKDLGGGVMDEDNLSMG